MPAPVKVRTPKPSAPARAPSVEPRRSDVRGATEPGPAAVVQARTLVGNTAVAAAMGGLRPGAEPGPSTWTGQMMLAAQSLVGNQAVVGAATAAAPVTAAASPAPSVEAPKKPESGKPKSQAPPGPKIAPPPAVKPELKKEEPKERPDKGGQKEATGPRSPGADPKFQALKKDVTAKKKRVGASHPPATAEAGAAQAAAVAPADDQEARGKAAHAEDMDAAQPKEFDKQTFINAVKKAVADKAPKNLDEADKFGESGKAEEVKSEVQGKVGEGKDASAKEIAETTAAPPEPAPDAKQVVPMAADQAPARPGAPDPAQATPDTLPPSATDMSEGPDQVNGQMADAQVTEKQLSLDNSNEPSFDKAVKDKKTMDAHSAAAPKKLRAAEKGELNEVKAGAATRGAAAMAGIHTARVATGKQVGTGKHGAKKTDEDKRKEVTDLLQKVFDETKGDVEKILTGLDKKVDDEFTTKEKTARDTFTREHTEGMERYKDERYGGWDGWLKWTRDLFAGLPEEANRIYERARDHYLAAMDAIITDIATIVEGELKRAKDRIATGRKDLQSAVDKLPADLKAIGRQAASDFEGKFDELTDTVNDKGTELVDTLATKYTDAVKAVDDEIAAEKEKNKGLVAKAAEAIGGAIKAIIELGRMLLGALAKAASAIPMILKDPIGFLGNLVTGVGGGLKLFMKNAGRHLEAGVLAWLLGTAATAGIQLPASFDVLGILTLIATLLGLSWANIRSRLARKVPNQALVAAETAVPLVAQVKRRGVAGLWDELKTRVGDLKKDLIKNLVDYLLPTIIIAGITWIVSLFNPASAFIRACKMIIDIIRFIVTNARQIIDFVNAVLDAVIAIAKGGTGGVPALVERALARAIPVLIGALAALLGLGGIAGKIKGIFQKLSRPVNRAIDWVITKITGLIKKLWAKLKPKRPRRKPRDARKKPREETRSAAKKERDLATAVDEADRLLIREVPEKQLDRRLRAIKTKYRLSVLRLVVDSAEGAEKVVHVHGEINPRRDGQRRRTGRQRYPEALDIPARAKLRPAGRNQYSYDAGNTQIILDRLRAAGARVTEGSDHAGSHLITATITGHPQLRFVERSTPPDLKDRLVKIREVIEHRGVSRQRVRTTVRSQLRSTRDRPGRLEGFVLDTVLAENQRAVRRLAGRLTAGNPDVIVGMERGGAFLVDVLAAASPGLAGKMRKMPAHKAPDPVAAGGKFVAEAVQRQFERYIAQGARRIAVVDFYMGGPTARSLRAQIFLPLAGGHPDVRFDTLWIRELMGFEQIEAGGATARANAGEPQSAEEGHRLSTTEFPVRMVLGDDMNVVLDPNSREPITIFDRQGRIVRVLYPDSSQTTRQLMIALLNQQPGQ